MEENARRMADGEPDRTESDLCKNRTLVHRYYLRITSVLPPMWYRCNTDEKNGTLWNDLRAQLMQTAHIRSAHFAETLMQEARDSGLIQTLLINGRREYLLQRQQQLFDEDTWAR